ncbi:MAG: SMC-Scp complex subunit ScpB [Candidatus Bathyarchaeota archaeon]|jgi:segregation and condensation protein B|nr:SMC-Scp complex subunit ScpB [Candidatus Bathyarchaeota archaeon]
MESHQKSPPNSDLASRNNVNPLQLLEAALYVAGRPLDLKALGSIIKTRSKKRIQRHIRQLIKDYDTRAGALEIAEFKDGRYSLQLKAEYVSLVKQLTLRPLLTLGPLKTLAYIAYQQPITQSQVTSVRGSQAYTHIRELKRLGFLTTKKLGRTQILQTSQVFADYFNLSRDPHLFKQQIETLMQSLETPKDMHE